MTTKVVVIGPPHSGKTTIANYLADATDSAAGDYHPTAGVRILEFSCKIPNSKSVDVELWDCGGNPQNEMCWPALARGATALILVAPAGLEVSEAQFLEMLYLRFGAQHGLKESQCAVFLHRMGDDDKVGKIPTMLSKLNTEIVTLESGKDLRSAFCKVVASALNARDEEWRHGENQILSQ